MYNAPRAATIRAKTDSILFELDRECFNHIVKEAAMRKREKYDNFLKSVEIFSTMDPYERSQIADALKPVKFQKGDYVVKQVLVPLNGCVILLLKFPRVKKEIPFSL